MPYYVLNCVDNENVLEKRLEHRPKHIKRLEELDAKGKLITAGALPKDPDNINAGFYGSVIIVEFDNREALDNWLAEEPFMLESIYSHIDVKCFNMAFPKSMI